ncbi:TlpA disulfide reductase family protein [uncultured Lacinutrix sp.]|uniref:TlpA family protein disulfide reductase n=1 Tax=uncultured Lacinutrix sp. TaxID=574032 RepID=UPI0026346CE5|nr:TlpA disulfide reductase family protein [uncultured Lacinutrix sp.]
MKKLLICISAIAIVACKEDPKIDYTILSGEFGDTKAKEITLIGGDVEEKIAIDAEGKFLDTLTIKENGFYTLSLGRERANLYLKAGANIAITKDSLGFSFSGVGAKESSYLASKNSNNKKFKGNAQSFYTLDEAAFKEKVNEIKESHKSTLDITEGLDKNFINTELKNLEYDSYAALDQYENAHSYFTKNDTFKTSDNFLPKAFKDLIYNDVNAYKTSSSYQRLAFKSVMDPIYEGLEDYNSITPSDLSTISTIEIPELKNKIVQYLAGMALSPANASLTETYAFLNNNTTDEKVKKELKKGLERAENLVKGKPSPVFVNYENHKGGTTSLSDLKGKYVYVDVWATWCGPCKAEIPSLKKIEKEYHDKNIAFVSTSIDVADSHQKWVDMVNKEELGGVQLMADNDWKSKFVVDYGINGIPRFILIDPQGNIVNADAPRPSNPKLKELFNSLNI